MKDSFRFACCPFISSMLVGFLILSAVIFIVVPEGTSRGDQQEGNEQHEPADHEAKLVALWR